MFALLMNIYLLHNLKADSQRTESMIMTTCDQGRTWIFMGIFWESVSENSARIFTPTVLTLWLASSTRNNPYFLSPMLHTCNSHFPSDNIKNCSALHSPTYPGAVKLNWFPLRTKFLKTLRNQDLHACSGRLHEFDSLMYQLDIWFTSWLQLSHQSVSLFSRYFFILLTTVVCWFIVFHISSPS